jgi:glycopeptide antibiotics resistance protein
MSNRRLHPTAWRAVAVALAAWTVVLALTLLAPSSAGPSWLVDTVATLLERLGVPDALAAPARVEFGLNVAAFVPLSLLGTLLWPRLTWRDWTAGGFAASFLVEAVQAVALDGRSATHSDVVANTLGTLVGALLGLGLLAALGARPARRSEDRADLADRHTAAEELEPPR